ncbi:hypothetical protein [Streptomyces sp. NPDC058401]|uniref:hypothetical protein n=1 Tax=Streptomyces sp. NPDC058401 TaxID=3346480 RepID=UPI003650074A
MDMDLTAIAHAVQIDGVKRLQMRTIKAHAAPDRARLSLELCAEIRASFDKLGIMTLPLRLPTSENDFVFLFEKSGPIGQAVAIASSAALLDRYGQNPLSLLLEGRPGVKEFLIP